MIPIQSKMIKDYKKLKEEAIQNFQFVIGYFEPYSSFISSSLCGQIFNEVAHQTRYKIPFEQKFMYRTSIEAGKVAKAKFLENPTPFWEMVTNRLSHVSTLPLLLKELTSIERFFILIEEEPTLEEVECLFQKNPMVEENLQKILLEEGLLPRTVYKELRKNGCFPNLISLFLKRNQVVVEEEKEIEATKEDRLNSVSLYLEEVRKIPLLTTREEMRLGQLILAGKKEAILTLVEHNLLLSVFNSRSFAYNQELFLDSIQYGNMKLMVASQNYNWLTGWKFSTYAMLWLQAGKERFFKNYNQTLSVSYKMQERLVQLRKKENELTILLGHKPTIEQIADALNWDREMISKMQQRSQKSVSIDGFLSKKENENYDFFEFYQTADTAILSPEEEFLMQEEKEWAKFLLEKLTDEQKEIASIYVGLSGKRETLATIGKRKNVSRQYIQQKWTQIKKDLQKYELLSNRNFFFSADRSLLNEKPILKVMADFEEYSTDEFYRAIARLTDLERTKLLSLYSKEKINKKEEELLFLLKEKIKNFILERRKEENSSKQFLL